jgi:WD40 repeat protein
LLLSRACSFDPLARHKLTSEPFYGRFSPDGSVFAAAIRNQIVLYDCRTGQARPFAEYGDWHRQDYRCGVTALAFSNDARLLAAGANADRTHTRVKLWDLDRSGRADSFAPLDHGAGYAVIGLEFSPDDKQLAAVVHRPTGTGATLFLWDLPTAAATSSSP